MTLRSDRIPLPAAEARCEPATTCTMRASCARALAAYMQGSPNRDYSLDGGVGGTLLCRGFVNVATLRAQPTPAPARKVHPAL